MWKLLQRTGMFDLIFIYVMYILSIQIFAKHLLCPSNVHGKEARKDQKQILSSWRRDKTQVMNKWNAFFKVVDATNWKRTGESSERKDNLLRLLLS